MRKPSDGSSAEETLRTQGPEIATSAVVDLAPGVRYWSYDRFNAPVVGGRQYDGNFSPDGHWLAYFPDETGQPEVYIVPFPETGGKPE